MRVVLCPRPAGAVVVSPRRTAASCLVKSVSFSSRTRGADATPAACFSSWVAGMRSKPIPVMRPSLNILDLPPPAVTGNLSPVSVVGS